MVGRDSVNVLVVFAHPDRNSCGAALERLLDGMRDAGAGVVVRDLYSLGFEPRLSSQEFARERKNGNCAELPADIREEQRHVRSADALVLVFPLWWSDAPAILKGWFDRVWTKGFAWAYGDGNGELKARAPAKAVLVVTAGASPEKLKSDGIIDALRAVSLGDRLRNVGYADVELVLLANLDAADEVEIALLLERAYLAGVSLSETWRPGHRATGAPVSGSGERISFRIRPGVESDAAALSRVHFAAVRGTAAASYPPPIIEGWAPPPDEARQEQFRRAIAGGDESFVVAEHAGDVVGFGSIVVSVHELRSVYVHPTAGRRGVGGAIVGELERVAVSSGIPALDVTASLNAEAFYVQRGYQVLERTIHRSRSGLEMACVKMKKSLVSEATGSPGGGVSS